MSAPLHAGMRPPPQTRGRPPHSRTPPPSEQTPPALGDTGNKRAIHILLECILVSELQTSILQISQLRANIELAEILAAQHIFDLGSLLTMLDPCMINSCG